MTMRSEPNAAGRETPRRRMEAFDRLPERMRALLRSHPRDVCPVWALALVERWGVECAVRETLRQYRTPVRYIV